MPKAQAKTAPAAGNKNAIVMAKAALPIADLRPDPENPRFISDEALLGLEASEHDFGDISGIVFNTRTKQLVCGHQRLIGLQRAGATEWRLIDKDRGIVLHPVTGEPFYIRLVDWDLQKQRLANLAANNPGIAGEYTEAALAQLKALEEDARFSSLRLDALMSDLQRDFPTAETPTDGNTDADSAAEPPAEPVTRLGDLWILGEHRLLCGDSTNPAHVARLFKGSAPAMLMATDPPYGVDYTATKAGMPVSGLGDAQERWGDIENDALDPKQLHAFLQRCFLAADVWLARGHASYVWHPPGELNDVFRRAMREAGYIVHRQIIWKKPGFVLTRSGMYHWAHETAFYGWRQGNVPPWYGEKNQTSVWEVGKDDGKAVHPTQKPVALFEIPMMNHTRKGEVCYEPFSGSGSQLIAGERLGRKVLAMELSPRWCDAAVARWEAFTGRKAECHHAELPPRDPQPTAESVHGEDDVAF